MIRYVRLKQIGAAIVIRLQSRVSRSVSRRHRSYGSVGGEACNRAARPSLVGFWRVCNEAVSAQGQWSALLTAPPLLAFKRPAL